MVATDRSTRPSTESSPNIVPQIWSITGEAIKFRFVSDLSTIPPPPSPEFFSKFRPFLDEKGIDTLGIFYAENDLKDGDIYEEGDGPRDRERIATRSVNRSHQPTPTKWCGPRGTIQIVRISSWLFVAVAME